MKPLDAEQVMNRIADDGFHQAMLNWNWMHIDDAEFQQRLNAYREATDELFGYLKENLPE